jgi:hypothetical protein
MTCLLLLFADLEGEQTLRPQHQNSDNASSVSTFAIDPDMKNSSVDCVCEIEKAEAMVPSRLAAPPNTTTRKVSTM